MEMNKAVIEQPEPKEGREKVLDLVVKDLKERAGMGKERYGTYLKTHNGRDALWDAYQEALDLCMYLRQELAERESDAFT